MCMCTEVPLVPSTPLDCLQLFFIFCTRVTQIYTCIFSFSILEFNHHVLPIFPSTVNLLIFYTVCIHITITPDKRGIRKIFFLISPQKHSLWYSLEVPHWGFSNEYPQHMFLWTNKKYINNFWLKKNCLIWSYAWCLLQRKASEYWIMMSIFFLLAHLSSAQDELLWSLFVRSPSVPASVRASVR